MKFFQKIVVLCLALMLVVGSATHALASGTTSDDLSQFLSAVYVNGHNTAGGSVTIDPRLEQDVEFEFKETPTLQFDNDAVLTMPLTGIEGFIGPLNIAETKFDIVVQRPAAGGGIETYTIEDNTFEVVNGQLRVKFNSADADFSHLQAAGNVTFRVGFKAKINKTEVGFANNITGEFNFVETGSIAIAKTGVYLKESNKARYTVTLTSTGQNANVQFRDVMEGIALSNQHNVQISTSHTEAPGIELGTYATDPADKSIKFTFNRDLYDGETVTVTYDADVDLDHISGTAGTAAQTKNTAYVKSTQMPDEAQASTNLEGLVTAPRISKDLKGQEETVPGKYKTSWTITVNPEHLINIGGNMVADVIQPSYRPYMSFDTSAPLTMAVTPAPGASTPNAGTITVPWEQLSSAFDQVPGTFNPATGKQWVYRFPADYGKAKVVITVPMLIDITQADITYMTLVNRAIYMNGVGGTTSDDASLEVGDPNALPKHEKAVVESTSEYTEWVINVPVRAAGYSDIQITDGLPQYTYNGVKYWDYVDLSTIKVEGLVDGQEDYDLYFSPSNNSDKVTYFDFTFFKKVNGNRVRGLLPTPTDRTLRITFRTKVNQEWLNITHESGYKKGVDHVNSSRFLLSGTSAGTVTATARPRKATLEKKAIEIGTALVDDVRFPVFTYKLTLKGVDPDSPKVINETFNTTYFKLYGVPTIEAVSAEGIHIAGTIAGADAAAGALLTVGTWPLKSTTEAYPTYEISYRLIVRDAAQLAALNFLAEEAPTGYPVGNKATWGGLEADETVLYSPYMSKELLSAPTGDNGYKARFRVVINPMAMTLNQGEPITVTDKMSPNLRLAFASLNIQPGGIQYSFDPADNILTFSQVPDATRVVITYEAQVLGKGDNVAYGNTVTFGRFHYEIQETVAISSSGSGAGSVPGITLIKGDKNDNTLFLAGATFELYKQGAQGSWEPVKGEGGTTVSFTTNAEGKVVVTGDMEEDGWVLYEDATYKLVETVAPVGYPLEGTSIIFRLTSSATSGTNDEYPVLGGEMTVFNEREKRQIHATKMWAAPGLNAAYYPEMTLTLERRVSDTDPAAPGLQPGAWEAVPGAAVKTVNGTTTAADWEGLYAKDLLGIPYEFRIVEAFKNPDDPVIPYWEIVPETLVGENQTDVSITNVYKPQLTEITVEKQWANVPEGETVPTVWLRLVQIDADDNESVIITVRFDPGEDLTHTVGDLPKHDEQGRPYIYVVSEGHYDEEDNWETWTPEGYVAKVDGYKVTNTRIKPVAWSYTFGKTVHGLDAVPADKFGVQVIDVKGTYMPSGIPGSPVTIYSNNPKADEFKIGPITFDKPGSHVFQVEEIDGNVEGFIYDSTVYTFRIDVTLDEANAELVLSATISHINGEPIEQPEEWYFFNNAYTFIDIEAEKIWVGGEGPRPDIWFRLARKAVSVTPPPMPRGDEPQPARSLQDWVDAGWELLPVETIKKLSDGETTAIWLDMPSLDPDGNLYEYIVLEVDEEGNDYTPEHYIKFEKGLTIYNVYNAVTATKVWEGGEGPRPDIWFRLARKVENPTLRRSMQDMVDDGWELLPVETIKKLSDGETSVTWDNMPLFDDMSDKYTYIVIEVDEDGNDYTPPVYQKQEDGLTVTNTYDPTLTDITATKEWVGGNGPRPDIWLRLERINSKGDSYMMPVDLIQKLSDSQKTATWTDLEVEDTLGGAYTYLIHEVDAEGNDFVPAGYTKVEDGLKVTNTYPDPIPTPTPTIRPTPVPDPDYPAISVPLEATKVLTGGKLKDGQFTFELLDGMNKVCQTVTNDGSGKVVFKDRRFSRTGTFVYTVREVKGTDSKVRYDATQYKLSITITAVAGQLQANVNIFRDGVPYDGSITFRNTTNAPKTGDQGYALPLVLMLAAVAMLSIVYVNKKRQHQG